MKWDDLPSDECEVEGIKRQRLTIVSEGKEEKRFDEKYALQLELDELKIQKEAKKSPEVASEDRFVNKKKDELISAKVYEMKYEEKEDPILWSIHDETQYIENDDYFIKLKQESLPTINDRIDFTKPIHEFFF